MSRCPYCRRELPGLDTVCQKCLDARYDQVAHPKPWWQRIRLTHGNLYVFLFYFGYGYLLLRIDRDHHPATMTGRVGLAFVLAAFMTIVVFFRADSGKPKKNLFALYLFLLLFALFLFRIWIKSTYHPFPMPALFALAAALIAAFSASVRDPVKVREGQKKAPEEQPAPLYDSRDAV